MLSECIGKVVDGGDLTFAEAEGCLGEIMDGRASPAQIGAFMIALRMKGEVPSEIAGCATAMRRRAARIELSVSGAIDTCGTGGDGKHTFNISTAAAFVVAAAGVPVAKHGNRSVSSKCGSADVLEALGVNVGLTPADVKECVEQVGIGFLYAPTFHAAMRHAAGPRRELAIRSIFNLLGPLTNPAGATRQVLGVYGAKLTSLLGRALLQLGAEHALVVHGSDGLDELSISGPTVVCEVREGSLREYVVRPEDYGLRTYPLEEIVGGDKEENVRIVRDVLTGREQGAPRDVVLLNAGAGLVVGGAARDLGEGVELARGALDSGAAYGKLEELADLTQQLAAGTTEAAL